MNSKSKISIFGGGVIVGIAFLFLMGSWNNPLPPVNHDSDIPAVPVAGNNDADSHSTEQVDTGTPETPAPVTTEQTSDNQQTVEQPASESGSVTSTEADTPIGATSPDDNVEQPATTSTTYVTSYGGGHGHGSSHPSSDSSGDSNQDSSGAGDTGTDDQTDGRVDTTGSENAGDSQDNSTSDGNADSGQDDLPPEDFFVLPESPVGAAALVVSSMAVLGAFMFLRGKSHAGLPA